MDIDDDVVKRTVHCENEMKCIKNDQVYCNAECFNPDGEHKNSATLECLHDTDCIYKLNTVSDYFFCGCPVRRHIYKKYGK